MARRSRYASYSVILCSVCSQLYLLWALLIFLNQNVTSPDAPDDLVDYRRIEQQHGGNVHIYCRVL